MKTLKAAAALQSRKKQPERNPWGLITMYVPPTLSVTEAFFQKVENVKPGVYVSIDQLTHSICKQIHTCRR